MDAPTACPACGRRIAPRQEYCLECGLRQPRPRGLVGALGGAWRRVLPWYPGDWIWPALGALVVAAAGATVAIAANGGVHRAGARTVIALPALVQAPPPAPPPPPKTAKGKTPAAKAPKANVVISWPGQNGATIVLATFPSAGGGAAAREAAQKALAAGLPQVGILVSSNFASLHPGYYVVFTGVYATVDDANAALPGIAARFPNAYARQIAR
jgi:hypothetical protein